jgi:hypothetical protein
MTEEEEKALSDEFERLLELRQTSEDEFEQAMAKKSDDEVMNLLFIALQTGVKIALL